MENRRMVTINHFRGGFKYNPPDGGPAAIHVTEWIEKQANTLLGRGHVEHVCRSGKHGAVGLVHLFFRGICYALAGDAPGYDERWTKSIAIGDKDFVERIKKKLGYRGKYHKFEN